MSLLIPKFMVRSTNRTVPLSYDQPIAHSVQMMPSVRHIISFLYSSCFVYVISLTAQEQKRQQLRQSQKTRWVIINKMKLKSN